MRWVVAMMIMRWAVGCARRCLRWACDGHSMCMDGADLELLDAVRVLEAETELARWRRHGDGHSAQLANDLVLRELAPFKMGVDHLPRGTKGGG